MTAPEVAFNEIVKRYIRLPDNSGDTVTNDFLDNPAIAPAGIRPLIAFLGRFMADESWRTATRAETYEFLTDNFGSDDILYMYLYNAMLQHRWATRDKRDKAQYITMGNLIAGPKNDGFWQSLMAQGPVLAGAATTLASTVGAWVPAAGSLADVISDVAVPYVAPLAPLMGPLLLLGSTMAYYFEIYDPESEVSAASYGAAYQALKIDPDLGRLIDNDYEQYFLTHLVTMLQGCAQGDQIELSKAESVSGQPWPVPSDTPKKTEWVIKWCEWVNNEFRAWIELNFRTTIRKADAKQIARRTKLEQKQVSKVLGSKPCSPAFVDLATYHTFVQAKSSAMGQFIMDVELKNEQLHAK